MGSQWKSMKNVPYGNSISTLSGTAHLYGRVLGQGTYFFFFFFFFYFVGFLEISTYSLENSTEYLEISTY